MGPFDRAAAFGESQQGLFRTRITSGESVRLYRAVKTSVPAPPSSASQRWPRRFLRPRRCL